MTPAGGGVQESAQSAQSALSSRAASPVHAANQSHTDVKPLSSLPPPRLANGAGMQRSKTLPTATAATVDVGDGERRHYDPSREPKLLHFM